MATNYYQDGDIIDFIATADIKSGELAIKGKIIGVAITDIKLDEVGAVQRTGIWTLPKEAGKTFGQGDEAYYDTTNKVITSTSSGTTKVGIAAYPSASADTEVNVLINAGN